jgi:mannosyltransferase OCH1-like enzyme
MVLIPEFLPPRNDRLIINHYEIINHGYPDEFHIVVYFVEKNKCKIIVRRMDSEDGWGLDLQIKIGDDIITIGPSNQNFICITKHTKVNLTPREPQEQKIPKTIIQTYSSTRPQSLLHYNAVMSFIELNPDYSYHFFDNKKSRQFIKDNFPPRVLKAYDVLNPKAFKADLFRYCYIFKHGGCYFDHKFVCQTPLFKYIKPEDSNVFCKDMYEYGMFNAVFISVAQTNEMKATINKVVRNVEEKQYGRGVLDVTGPMLFDQFTHNQNVCLHHTDGRKIMYNGHQILKTAFSGYYDKQVLRKENYGDLWVQKLVYYSNYCESNNYIIMTKPISVEQINEVRVAMLTKGRLHRVKERIIQSSKQFNILFIHFSFELNGNQLKIKRIDSNSGWDNNIIVTIINNQNSDSRDINVGSSSSNFKIISI